MTEALVILLVIFPSHLVASRHNATSLTLWLFKHLPRGWRRENYKLKITISSPFTLQWGTPFCGSNVPPEKVMEMRAGSWVEPQRLATVSYKCNLTLHGDPSSGRAEVISLGGDKFLSSIDDVMPYKYPVVCRLWAAQSHLLADTFWEDRTTGRCWDARRYMTHRDTYFSGNLWGHRPSHES